MFQQGTWFPSSESKRSHERNNLARPGTCFWWFLAWLTLRHWRWKQYIPPKPWSNFTRPDGVTFHNKQLFSYLHPNGWKYNWNPLTLPKTNVTNRNTALFWLIKLMCFLHTPSALALKALHFAHRAYRYLCVSYDSQTKEWLFSWTALTDCRLYWRLSTFSVR